MIDGKWRAAAQTPMGRIEVICEMTVQGGSLTGKLIDAKSGGATEIFEGKANGDVFSFKTAVKLPLGRVTLTMKGTVAGDAFSGEAVAAMGKFAFAGKRISG